MCSKCHREHVSELERKVKASAPQRPDVSAQQQQQAAPPPSSPSPSAAPEPAPSLVLLASSPSPCPGPAAEASSSQQQQQVEQEPGTSGSGDGGAKAPTRCLECRKKVGLTGFRCKCGNLYCGSHRYAESHSCTFDYKTLQRQKLAESNPVVQASKVQRI